MKRSRRGDLDQAEHPPELMLSPRLEAAAAAALLLLGLAHMLTLWFVSDDAFISYRYARNLAGGISLVYNPGERVEGYSNFLWTLIASLVIRAGGRPELWMPGLGVVCSLGTLGLVMAAIRRRGASPLLAGAILAANPAFAAYATSGLETALFTLLVTSATLATAAALAPGDSFRTRPLLGSAFLLGLASLTRPEGALVTACVGALLLTLALLRCGSVRSWMAWAGAWLVVAGPHLAWRLAYYHRFLPNSFAIKAPGLLQAPEGGRYVILALGELHLLWLVPAIVASLLFGAWRGLAGRELGLMGAIVLPFLAYVCATGGDWMPLFRFVVPMLPLIALVAAAALEGWMGFGGSRAARRLGWAFAMVSLMAYVSLDLRASWRQQVPNGAPNSVWIARRDLENWRRLGEMLERVTQPTDTLATTAAGVIPYVSGLYTIDLLGLCAPDHSRYRRRATDRPGHQWVLAEAELYRLRPQILLGHPVVRDTLHYLGMSLDIDPAWRDRIVSSYSLVGLTLPGTPVRYAGCMLRNDVAERVLEAGRRLAPPP